MELGIGMFGDVSLDTKTGKYRDASVKLNEILEQVKLMDQVGLDVFAMGEHHREDYAVSSPEILLAAAASVTQNIKLASGVTVLSSSEPVKVYQDFSMIDLISKGRAEIFVGRGSFIESFPLYGYDLSDYNQLFEEKLDLLLKINNEEVHWVREDLRLKNGEARELMVRIRYRQTLEKATLYQFEEGFYIEFENPQSAIAEGQFAAWYDGEELLGSGVIS